MQISQLSNGDVTSEPREINDTFKQFYSNLYQSEIPLNQDRCDCFLGKLELSLLPEAECINLEKPISIGELRDADIDMHRGKAPGLDGIPPEFYVTFWEQISPFLLQMIERSLDSGRFSRDVNTL